MPTKQLDLLPQNISHLTEGQTFTLDNKKYKLLKKRTTAVSVKRQYWFDDLFDWLARKAGNDAEDYRYKT